MKIKLFVTCEIQCFELGIFSFNSYVYYLCRGFIASARAFNLPTRAFNLAILINVIRFLRMGSLNILGQADVHKLYPKHRKSEILSNRKRIGTHKHSKIIGFVNISREAQKDIPLKHG